MAHGRLATRREGGRGRRGAPALRGPGAVPGARAPADESERLVAGYTGLKPLAGALPVAEAIDRRDLDRGEPALDARRARSGRREGGRADGRRSAASSAAPRARCSASRRARSPASSPAACSASTSSPCSTPTAPARLLFVAPNLGHAAGTLDAEPDQLLRWVALHETTHALQFGGVPWLREHLAGMVRELTAALDARSGQAVQRAARPRRPPRARSTPSARAGSPPSCSAPSGAS